MNIRMLSTRMGCEDGHAVNMLYRNQTYNVADTLARSFILSGWAVETRTEISETLI